ncbi:MAG: helix-turn-helix domain-containing protein [Candidatus Omnitrophica bacterium]|nr:helix-turn-helix domain-containing protein [Candidatus Omnitrophota bacterium]
MTTTQFISVRETAQILGISEKKVMDLIEEKRLYAYRIADKFLRLKRSEVMALRNSGRVVREDHQIGYAASEKLTDFFYFNDFYLICGLIILGLLYVIFYM